MAAINSWRFPGGSYVIPCAATVAALALQIAGAAATQLTNLAAQAAVFIPAM